MANGKEIDFGIVVGAVPDENSAKDAVNKLTKGILSTLKDGYIPVPAELKVPIKGASNELLKAQEKVVDQWDKTFAKGFSTSKKDMNELVDIYMEFKRLAKEQGKTSSGPVKKITALMGDQIQEYDNQRKAKRAERVKKTNRELKKRKNKSDNKSNTDARTSKRESPVKIPAKSRTNVKAKEHVTETTLKETKYQGFYRSGLSRTNAASLKEERPKNAKSLTVEIVGVKKTGEYAEKIFKEGKLYDTDTIRSRNKKVFTEKDQDEQYSKIALSEAAKLLGDIERGRKGDEAIDTHQELIQGSYDLTKKINGSILDTTLSTINSAIGRYFKNDGYIEIGGNEYAKGEGPGHELAKEAIKNTLDIVKQELKGTAGEDAEFQRQLRVLAKIDPREAERLLSRTTKLSEDQNTLLKQILSQIKYEKNNSSKNNIDNNASEINQVKKVADKLLTQNKVEAASERVSDTNQEMDLAASKEAAFTTQEIVSSDAGTGMNTDANARDLIKTGQASNRIDDKNRQTLKSILSAIKGPTSDEEIVEETPPEKTEQKSRRNTQLSVLKIISANVSAILKALGGEPIETEGPTPPNKEETTTSKEGSNLPDLYRYIEDGIMKTAEAISHKVIPETAVTMLDVTNPNNVRRRRAESDIEWERELVEQGKHPSQQRTNKTSTSEYIDKSLNGKLKKIFAELGFVTSLDKVMKMNQSEIEKLRAERIDTFGFAEADRDPTAKGDKVRAHRVKSVYGWGNKGKDPFENLKLSDGIGIDAQGITNSLQKLIEKNMFTAQTGGWFNNLIGPMTMYLGQPSLEKSRSEADAANQIMANIRNASLKLLETISAAETDLKGMERTGKAKFDASGNLISNQSSKDAIDAFAQMEDAKMALRGVLAEAKMVDVVTNRWRR